MQRITTEASCPFPESSQTLMLLEAAMRKVPVAAADRVVATEDSRSIEEGLAVLKCYVAIEDRQVRQALLDILVMVAGRSA